MNTNFPVRKVTGYDPGYPVGRRRPGRLEARPLKFLFLVVGFLFFFVGFGCEEKVKTTGVQVADELVIDEAVVPDYDDQVGGADTGPEYDIYEDDVVVSDDEDYVELDGLPSPDMVDIDVAETPDYDDLGGAPMPDTLLSDDDELLSDTVDPDGDELLADDQLTGFAGPDLKK